jgi:HK97 family phage prohead protease
VLFTAPLILRRAPGAKTGYFAGLASTYSVDRHGERIAPGAFARTLTAFNAGTQRIAVLHHHDPAQPIGKITAANETDAGLDVEGEIVLGSPIADRDHQMLLADAAGLSVGFAVADSDVTRDAQGIKTYTSCDLMEVSIVGVPSNREAIVHTVRGLAASSPAQFERLLRDGALPAMPRRLAAKLAQVFRSVIAEDDPGLCAACADGNHADCSMDDSCQCEDPTDGEIDPAALAALQRAIERLKKTYLRKSP